MGHPSGIRGSWFATWRGERLPCVHQHWTKASDRQLTYRDPHVTSDAVWSEFIAAIMRGRRVILTTDQVGPGSPPSFKRTGYVALYAVDGVEVLGSELRFRFVERLENFR